MFLRPNEKHISFRCQNKRGKLNRIAGSKLAKILGVDIMTIVWPELNLIKLLGAYLGA